MMRKKEKCQDSEDKDKISGLPDELLLKILLLLPTKTAVRTSILSKRWEFLWMWLPKLEYDCSDYSAAEQERLKRFINLNLPFHKAPVIESLHLKFNGPVQTFEPQAIELWVAFAVSHCIRELSLAFRSDYSAAEQERLKRFINLNLPFHKAPVIESLHLKFNGPVQTFEPQAIELWVAFAVSHCIRELSLAFRVIRDFFIFMRQPVRLPSSLYICKSLVILNLNDDVLIDVPRMACLPFLKTLLLRRVTYSDENSLQKLLSSCPVLEDLVLERSEFDHFGTWKVNVPSLQRLTVEILRTNDFRELVVKTPSLKYFKVTEDYTENGSYSFSSNTMPKLEEVEIDSVYLGFDKFVTSITFVKRLSICVGANPLEALYREGIDFNHLKHLKLCQCDYDWSKLLAQLLKDSPNLQELEVYLHDGHEEGYFHPMLPWEDGLNCVPKCLLSSLETFKWTRLFGTEKERHLLKYILRNACCLKTGTILFMDAPERQVPVEMMIQDLLLSPRGSTTCQLVLNCEF
ncbi:PREDICTED: putative F-box/LRR-repeat protein At4g15060 [Camelina sativa]|uniref:F-box/LRR-repeat protein At4g15060 n=1 Tax=Camelina sativa TaxID=90675 RepID=A0ABM0UFE1_CAMSA|nr:PREDICTED: putative F-box/LRR-repeat protein At4g15060 [Camelina sativa]